MNWSNEFVVLDKELHDRASFDCGEAELNEFIQQRAAKHMEIGISTTLILPASEPLPNGKSSICAYFTVTPGSVTKATLPISQGKKLPNYPVPVFLIAQLAVHNELKGRGLGKITLVKALEYLWDISKHMKAYAVIVDCLNPGVVKFYEQYDFQPLCIVNGKTRMFLPMKTVELLFNK